MDKTVRADTAIFAAPHEGVATGRNGTMRVSGLRAWRSIGDQYVTLEPLTSRGLIGNCRIVVPTAELPRVIEMLKDMLEAEAPAPAVIVVTVEGGVVHDVTGVPPGVTVEVHDYDVEGDVPADTETDPDGNGFRRGIWGGQVAPAQTAQVGLLAAARGVIANWEHGDLAAAVRELTAAVSTVDDPVQAAHLLHRGGRCPACGSGDICGDSFEYDGAEHWQEVNCWTCGASWTDVFRLAGFTDLKKGED